MSGAGATHVSRAAPPQIRACATGLPLQGWEGMQARAARLSMRLRLAFGAVASSRPRHRYLFGRSASAAASGIGSEAHVYSRVGSGAEEERDGEEEGQGSAHQPSLQAVLVRDGIGSRASGLGEGARSPRQPLLEGRRGMP